MKRAVVGSLVISFSLLLKSCNSVEPSGGLTINLSLEDISCTEAWVTLSSNLKLPAAIELKQNSQIIRTINLNSSDSLLYIDSLLPNTSYTFQTSNDAYRVTSNQLQLTTLDTTSHNFTFETFTFGGQVGSCALYDVAIVNDTCIYAVGEIYLLDTLGQPDPESYGFAHWNGNEWKLTKLTFNCRLYYPNCGPEDTITSTPAYSVFAYSPNDVWVAAGSVHHFDGTNWTEEAGFESAGDATKIWGSTDHQLWFVNHNGFIAHRSADGTWQQIESGTSVNINDVFGVEDSRNNQLEIFCSVSNVLEISDHKILTIDESNNIDSLHWNQDRRINSTWSNNGWIVYTSGGGVFNNKSGNWKEETTIPLYYTNRIRGNGLNDIIVAGDFGLLAHFNGTNWKVYDEFLQLPVASFNVDIKGNIIVAVGYTGEKALIVIGRRN